MTDKNLKGSDGRIVFDQPGPPEVMRWEVQDLPPPPSGEVRLRHRAIGLNYVDTYFRSGLYKTEMPSGLGSEASGIVEALGAGVEGLKVGERVAYGTSAAGAYSTVRNMPARHLIKIPDEIADETAAAMMLKGMTVRYLLQQSYVVKPGDTILLHAAAGGIGLIAAQWAKALGATVIGTVGSPAKVVLAKAHGCDHVIDMSQADFVAEVKRLTDGKGVPVVYDGIGKDTFMQSLDCLKTRGMMVVFGNASGAVEAFNPGILSTKGSLFLTRPTLYSYTETVEELRANARDVLAMVSSGKVKINVNQRYALRDVVQAHLDLTSRKTTGCTVLLP